MCREINQHDLRALLGALHNVTLDSAGSFLIVDGASQNQHRVVNAPYLYPLDTRTLRNGSHTLQIWVHDTGNNTTLSSVIQVNVAN